MNGKHTTLWIDLIVLISKQILIITKIAPRDFIFSETVKAAAAGAEATNYVTSDQKSEDFRIIKGENNN